MIKKIGSLWVLILVGACVSIVLVVWTITASIVIADANIGISHRMREKGPCIEETLYSDPSCWHPQHRLYVSMQGDRQVIICRCEPPTSQMMPPQQPVAK